MMNSMTYRMIPCQQTSTACDFHGTAAMLRTLRRENTAPRNQTELVRQLERLRRQYYDLLGSEPEEDRVLLHRQWREDMLHLRGRIQELKQCLAA